MFEKYEYFKKVYYKALSNRKNDALSELPEHQLMDGYMGDIRDIFKFFSELQLFYQKYLIHAYSYCDDMEDMWKNEVKAMAMMRGIGWVLLVIDRATNTMRNIWVSDHEVGHLAGCDVLFALDVWEHAYLLDYLPAQRADYVNAVFANVNWAAAEARFAA